VLLPERHTPSLLVLEGVQVLLTLRKAAMAQIPSLAVSHQQVVAVAGLLELATPQT
jgi:hypothetical protein